MPLALISIFSMAVNDKLEKGLEKDACLLSLRLVEDTTIYFELLLEFLEETQPSLEKDNL